MTGDRLITVAIHTYDRALALKQLLEREGVEAVLHNVNLSDPVISSGVRVRIHECDLPLALRIIENTEIFTPSSVTGTTESDSSLSDALVILPVDFSDYSVRASSIAFDIAYRHRAEILLLHSFINPAVSRRVQLSDSFSFELAETEEIGRKLENEAKSRMASFEEELRLSIKNGRLPAVKFTSKVCEGVPEDIINEEAKLRHPQLIVMGTRGANRKSEELIGSVTAELLDSCRFPVLSIPESSRLNHLEDITSIMFFCNLEQEDFLAIDAIQRLLASAKQRISVIIVHVPGKRDRSGASAAAAESLVDYCREHYPSAEFMVETLRPGSIVEDFKAISRHHDVSLVALPNKHRNVFFRFFNPSLAHKLLLHADIPLIVVPV